MLPAPLIGRLTDVLGAAPTGARSEGGGCINDAASFEAGGVRYFVKYHRRAPAGMFAAEAAGLRALSGGALAVPEPIAWSDGGGGEPGYLLMPHFGAGRASDDFAELLGSGLAEQHRRAAERHGFDHDNFIGSLPQSNDRRDRWPEFFGELRLGRQQEIAARSGNLSRRAHRALDRIRATIATLVPDAPASLLHGDLWSGNYAVGDGGLPVVFDPAVYHGHREIELAFTELFGGFSPDFYRAYEAAWPLDPGYRERRELYNLYPLLVHANLFGGGYGAQVERIAARFV